MTALSDEIDAMIAEHGGRVRDALNIAMAQRDALRAELADVRAQWQADVGSAIARAQTAEARAARLNTEVGYLLEENEEMGRREMQRAAAARKVARYAAQATASMGAMEEQVKDARAEAARLRKLLTRDNLPFAGTNAFVIGPGFCLWCGRSEPDHFDNCEYDAALRGPAPAQPNEQTEPAGEAAESEAGNA